MAKPFINYALVGNTYGDYAIMGVTSEGGRQVHGRWLVDDAYTHVRAADVVLRYDTAENAKAARIRAEKARAEWAPKVQAARDAERHARDSQRAAILAAAQPCLHPPRHIVSDERTSWCDVCQSPVDGDLTRPYHAAGTGYV